MVLGEEGEGDGVARGGIDTRGVENESTFTDGDWEVCRRHGRGKGGKDNDSEGEMHLGYLFSMFRLNDPEGVDDNLVSLL